MYVLQRYSSKYLLPDNKCHRVMFIGGEYEARQHIKRYFLSSAPSTYKETRNELDGWSASTKFSPYLSIGNISPNSIWHKVTNYEDGKQKNDSTYWIKFELLWREYFHWLAYKQKNSLYRFNGQGAKAPLTCFLPERFNKWKEGNTLFPIVNACMKQLNATGFMSNRGRQIVASCLVNELGCDWRFGAAYFQQQLIDHDVASNWGNWQYIAGVGANPRGVSHFNIEKQTQLYDPEKRFITKWQGDVFEPQLDSVDMVDWPQKETVEL
jgi:deoxyribodipyrimidine photo-lyase